uniref:Venom S1 protease with CUB domain 6 n=1 Tax=Oncocephalus sp. TaxID=2944721 RepID=A0AB38ZEM7_9HEMI
MLGFLLFALLLGSLNLAKAEDDVIILKRGHVYAQLKSEGYPKVTAIKKPMIWKFVADGNYKIRIQCEDFRLTKSKDCSVARLQIDDGNVKEDYCGVQNEFKVLSTTNKLTVKLEGDQQYGQAVFSCFVKNTGQPEPIDMTLNINQLYHFHTPKENVPFFDRVWRFKVKPGQRVQLKCFLNLLKRHSCFEETVTLNLGSESQKYCGFEKIVALSSANGASVRVELGKRGIGRLYCVAQAVVKIEPLVGGMQTAARSIAEEEEDSSEHGGAAGKIGTTCPCGWANKPKGRIIRGREASPNEYPWIVALKAHFGPAHLDCGGSIITHYHVVTAAHCLLNMFVDMGAVKPEDLVVIVGAHNLDKSTPKQSYKEYRAAQHFIRPEFTTQYTHDIALVVTKDKIEFSQSVGPICLSPKRIAEPRQRITIIGWGKTESGNVSTVLLKAKTSVIDRKRCDIHDHEICTRADQSATCTGDSGGPLSWLDPETNRYTLMSLVSYGDPDCVSSPSVSTDIAYFYTWIQEKIKATYPEEMTCTKK